ncbi:MAG: tripartite tricarboxylate transporter permease [Nanoarchaeota archaeon]
MIIEIISAIVLGILIGTVTGITPGIHINLTLSIFIPFIIISRFNPNYLIAFIISMAITHTFIDFIPSIYLGAPNEDTILSILPGHEFLLEGKGHEAVLLTLIGASSSTIILIILIPLFNFFVPYIFPFIQRMMAWILILISIFLISKEKNSKFNAFVIFILSGFLGIVSLNMSANQTLLPLLTGLFGAPVLIISVQKRIDIPEQKIGKFIFNVKELLKPILTTALVSPVCSFLPGVGSSQAAVIGSEITGNMNRKEFLIFNGSINTLVLSVSFLTLYSIQKSRSGPANAIQQIATLTSNHLPLIISSVLISALFSIFSAIQISKIFAKNINKINYAKISLFVLILMILMIFIFSGSIGLMIFVSSAFLGLTCTDWNVKRTHLMGCLLIPTILFYLPIF